MLNTAAAAAAAAAAHIAHHTRATGTFYPYFLLDIPSLSIIKYNNSNYCYYY
jgi:hypothetical protein